MPANDLAAIRELTRAPIIVLASGEASDLLEDALEADVADVLLLPQLTENVVFAIRKATHTRPPARSWRPGRHGKIVTVFSPKGGTGKTVIATNLAAALAKSRASDAAARPRPPVRRRRDHARPRAGEDDLRPRRRSGRARLREARRLHHEPPCGLDVLPAPLRPEDAELVTEAKLGRLLEVARESYDAIVVDTSPFFHGPMLATLDRTDELLLLSSLDVPTLKNLRLALQTLELLSSRSSGSRSSSTAPTRRSG
jgi:pilus assembly protein CpaE